MRNSLVQMVTASLNVGYVMERTTAKMAVMSMKDRVPARSAVRSSFSVALAASVSPSTGGVMATRTVQVGRMRRTA